MCWLQISFFFKFLITLFCGSFWLGEFCFLEFGDHLAKHGDGVKDIAFEVDDLNAIFEVVYLKIIICSIWYIMGHLI